MTAELKIDRETVEDAIAGIDWKKTATFPEPPKPSEFMELPIVQGLIHGVEEDTPMKFDGPPGIGKTSFFYQICAALGVDLVYMPCATVSAQDIFVPMVEKNADGKPLLRYLIDRKFKGDRPWILLMDELSRASKEVQNTTLEMVQSRRVASTQLTNLYGVFAADNSGKREGITAEPDLAAKDRWNTITIDSSGTPWQRALAEMWSDIDLAGVFRVYRELTPELRWHLNPRKLEHVIYNLLRGNPFIWSVSLPSGDRQWWVDEQGNDRTYEIGEKIAGALGVPLVEKVANPAARAVDCLIEDRQNVYIESPPGSGKTAYFESELKARGIDLMILSAPAVTPSDLFVPFPVDGELQLIPHERFTTDNGRPVALEIDEIWRARRDTRNALMEPLQNRTLAGVPIPNFLGTIATNNPKEVCGRKLDVGRPDPAQAGRFPISIQMSHDDIPGLEWLLATYGEEAEPIVAWYQEDLDDTDPARVLITRRTLERLIKLARNNRPLEWALTMEGGDRVCVAHLPALRERLENRPLARLKSIAAEVDKWEAWLSEGEGSAKQHTHPDKHHAVFTAFSKALIPQLEESRDVCVKLLRVLDNNYRIALIRSSKEKQEFWSSVLREAVQPAS